MKALTKKRYRRVNRREDYLTSMLLLLPYLLLFSLFIAIPVLIAIGLSFTYFDVIKTPELVGVSNYIALLTQDEIFLKYIIPNTFKYALIVGPGGCILSFVLAWLVTQIQAVPRTIFDAVPVYALHGGIADDPGGVEDYFFRRPKRAFKCLSAEPRLDRFSCELAAFSGVSADHYDSGGSVAGHGNRLPGHDSRNLERE